MNDKVCLILKKYLDCDCDNLSITLSSFEKWDSLTHIQMITDIERELDVVFDFEEIDSIKTLKDIFVLVSEKS
jgi:acyl carrier protein